MTETPTPTAKTAKPGVYLPVLPEGWTYAVSLTGPAGESVDVTDAGGQSYEIRLQSETINPAKPAVADTLHDAIRTAAKVAADYQKVQEAQREAALRLASFGADVFPADKPAPKKRAPKKAAATADSLSGRGVGDGEGDQYVGPEKT